MVRGVRNTEGQFVPPWMIIHAVRNTDSLKDAADMYGLTVEQLKVALESIETRVKNST